MFPVIKNISDILPAIAGKEEFFVCSKNGYSIVNYTCQLESTFENPYELDISEQEKLFRLIRRECRGIIFDAVSGDIISRPMSKFFNLGEKHETQHDNIDISESHVILAKLDGSFIRPFISDGKLIYGTKMGETFVTPMVETFVQDKQQYNDFNLMLLNKGFTPIYEFLSPLNRIVISYKVENLVLLAIRSMHTGIYHSYEDMKNLAAGFDIPVVEALSGSVANMKQFAEDTKSLSGIEGFVIRFDSGLQLKIKADEYIMKHRVKDSIQNEKNLVNLIFSEQMDDVYATLDEQDAEKVKKYSDHVLEHAMSLSAKLSEIVSNARVEVGEDKKRFACEIVPKHKEYSSLLFTIWQGKEAFKTIQDYVLSNCQTQSKIEKMRHILGDLVWNDVYISQTE